MVRDLLNPLAKNLKVHESPGVRPPLDTCLYHDEAGGAPFLLFSLLSLSCRSLSLFSLLSHLHRRCGVPAVPQPDVPQHMPVHATPVLDLRRRLRLTRWSNTQVAACTTWIEDVTELPLSSEEDVVRRRDLLPAANGWLPHRPLVWQPITVARSLLLLLPPSVRTLRHRQRQSGGGRAQHERSVQPEPLDFHAVVVQQIGGWCVPRPAWRPSLRGHSISSILRRLARACRGYPDWYAQLMRSCGLGEDQEDEGDW